jgi:ketosteroid isomerase-like protein
MNTFEFEAVEQEVRTAFLAYEDALMRNDVDAMDQWFWPDERLVRFGIAEIQHGAREVAAWRRTSPGVPHDRKHERVTVTAFDTHTAVVALEFRNGADTHVGRQSQLWRRTENGWRVVHAHVSMITNG